MELLTTYFGSQYDKCCRLRGHFVAYVLKHDLHSDIVEYAVRSVGMESDKRHIARKAGDDPRTGRSEEPAWGAIR